MTSDANLCSICGKSKVANPASPDAHCQGHAAAGDLKSQLDAIKTPGAAAQPAKVPPPVSAPKPASSQPDLKAQLDAIPSPGAAKTAPAPAPAQATAEPSLADQLNAIPTPKAAAATPAPKPASITKNQLDAIAAPSPKPPAAEAGGLSFQEQLNAIPTPGASRPAGSSPEHNYNDLNSIPTPRPGGAPPASSADQPEWMKKFNQYQAGITASSASGFPAQDPYANYQPQNREAPANSNSGYMMVAIFVGVLIIGYFCVLTMNKPQPLDPNKIGGTTTESSSPSGLSLPGTPVTPSTSLPGTPVQPFQQPAYTPPGQAPAPTENSVIVR